MRVVDIFHSNRKNVRVLSKYQIIHYNRFYSSQSHYRNSYVEFAMRQINEVDHPLTRLC
jgi:hypothetical protein